MNDVEVVLIEEQEIVSIEDDELVIIEQIEVELLSVGEQGPPGPAGTGGFISADPLNRSTLGVDGGIYTPEIQTDPLAYYILAKS